MPLTPPPLSSHLLCGEGPSDHEVPATHVLTYHIPKSHDAADGVAEVHLALCGHSACEHAAYRSTPAEAEYEPVRPLTADDVRFTFGYELDATLVGAA